MGQGQLLLRIVVCSNLGLSFHTKENFKLKKLTQSVILMVPSCKVQKINPIPLALSTRFLSYILNFPGIWRGGSVLLDETGLKLSIPL